MAILNKCARTKCVSSYYRRLPVGENTLEDSLRSEEYKRCIQQKAKSTGNGPMSGLRRNMSDGRARMNISENV